MSISQQDIYVTFQLCIVSLFQLLCWIARPSSRKSFKYGNQNNLLGITSLRAGFSRLFYTFQTFGWTYGWQVGKTVYLILTLNILARSGGAYSGTVSLCRRIRSERKSRFGYTKGWARYSVFSCFKTILIVSYHVSIFFGGGGLNVRSWWLKTHLFEKSRISRLIVINIFSCNFVWIYYHLEQKC